MQADNAPALLEGTFDGRSAFQQLVRDALAAAAREGWREIILSDASFEDWPLGERAVVESLSAWSKTGRTFKIMAKRYHSFAEKLPRFVTWRGHWSHIIDARAMPSADALDFPSVIYTPTWVMHRIDPVHCKGIASHLAQRRVALHEELDAWWHKGSAALPATTLGL
jgi:hypothetical protein